MIEPRVLQPWRTRMLRQYGRKQGVLRAWQAQLAFLAGRFERWESVRWNRVTRLVFVCRGNICRSPYAEARARVLGLPTTSFGLLTRGGASADPVAIRLALPRGIDLAGHRSRSVSELRLGPSDLLVGMEPSQLPALSAIARTTSSQVTVLGLWSRPVRPHLEDPFGLSDGWFDTCFDVIDSAVESMKLELTEPAPRPGSSPRLIGWRGACPILVAHAESLGALAVIRSLGRAGYDVHAISTRADALGLRSRFAGRGTVSPGYSSPDFVPWLHRYVEEHGIQAIVPSESLLLAIRPAFAEFSPLLTCGDREDVVYTGMSKYDLFASLLSSEERERSGHLPPTLLVPRLEHPPPLAALQRLGAPLYVKVDGSHARHGRSSELVKADTPEQARACLAALAPSFRKALVQGHVPGRGVGAFFLLHEGRVLAEFMHRRLHEVPHTGGASSLRESWFHAGIRDDALAKLKSLGWQGVAMMEYRWDERTGAFYFLEFNGRFWGSLHLALSAGVDFPLLLLDAFLGQPHEPVRAFPRGVRARITIPDELKHVWSKVKDPALAMRERLWPIIEFLLLSADPRVRSDLLFPGDRGLYWDGLFAGARELLGNARRRARRWRDAEPDTEDLSPADREAVRAVPGGAVADAR